MILLQDIKISSPGPCQYIPGEQWRFEYFFARGLSGKELEFFLERGWRKFGLYYFRPVCPSCRQCIPIRVRVDDFMMNKSQRRLFKKNATVRVSFHPLRFSRRVYQIYQDHSSRFEKKASELEDFISSFYSESCPSFQSEYHVDDKLIGVGFLDHSVQALSSVYFIYDTDFSRLGLGMFSIISEIGHAKSLGLAYYYLGYYIRECKKMSYKNRFCPSECYQWEKRIWSPGC